jgi:hypothetical protein
MYQRDNVGPGTDWNKKSYGNCLKSALHENCPDSQQEMHTG